MINPVFILLSTYNGEKYLAAQLDSLIAQTYKDWQLCIRDDGSNDHTLAIIAAYQQKDSRIILTKDQHGNLKSRGSFACLMEYALIQGAQYTFFCDQDDIWLPQKIEKTLNHLIELEGAHGKNHPLLVHSDLTVVNEDLSIFHPSYLRYEGLKRNTHDPLQTLLINNYVTGCTIGMNQALLRLATPVPEKVFMHDWWCGLCAASVGHIGFIDEALILYRQHAHNAIGSRGVVTKLSELLRIKASFKRRLTNLRICFAQAECLSQRIKKTTPVRKLINDFAILPNYPRYKRHFSVRKMQITAASKLRFFYS